MEPAIAPADAADMCEQVYADRQEAVCVARQLRAAGWIVPLLNAPSPPTADGIRAVAIVYHPQTYESPGEVTYADPGLLKTRPVEDPAC